MKTWDAFVALIDTDGEVDGDIHPVTLTLSDDLRLSLDRDLKLSATRAGLYRPKIFANENPDEWLLEFEPVHLSSGLVFVITRAFGEAKRDV